MYSRVPAALTEGQESLDLVAGFARQLHMHSEAIDAVRNRLRGAEYLDWQSPAGRNFSGYLAERGAMLAATAAALREAALSVEAYGGALAQAENQRALG